MLIYLQTNHQSKVFVKRTFFIIEIQYHSIENFEIYL